ncbi:MAG: repair protein RadA, partial [Actinomycetota bacterium]
MAKLRLIHRCTECAASFPKWSGKCLSCGAWNSLVEDVEGPEESAVTLAAGLAAALLVMALLWSRSPLPRLLRGVALRLPVLGKLLMKSEVAQFCRVLGSLAAAGMT